MIAEAVDTVVTLGWALAVWIVLLAATVTAGLYAVVVAVAWPCRTAREALSGAVAASRALRALREGHGSPGPVSGLLPLPVRETSAATGPSRTPSCRQTAPQASGVAFPAPAPQRRSESRHAPSWARTDKDTP